MTHQEGIGSAFADLNALLIDLGPAAIAEVFATLMNRDKQIEREQALKAESRSVPIVKATPTDSSRSPSRPGSARSICGFPRPGVFATIRAAPSTLGPSNEASAASGR